MGHVNDIAPHAGRAAMPFYFLHLLVFRHFLNLIVSPSEGVSGAFIVCDNRWPEREGVVMALRVFLQIYYL